MKNNKSSIFDIDESLFSSLLWIVAILSVYKTRGLIITILAFIILKLERNSEFIRNHAGQAFIASLSAFILSFLINSITVLVTALLSWIPGVNFATAIVLTIVGLLFKFIVIAYYLIGLVKAGQNKYLSLPIIGSLGEQVSKSIRP